MERGEEEHMQEQMKHQRMGKVMKSTDREERIENGKIQDSIMKMRESENKRGGNRRNQRSAIEGDCRGTK